LTVTTATEGTDTLTGFSVVQDGAGHKFFLVGADSQYTTLQAALNAASNGDTILLEPGTYSGDIVTNGKMVSFEGFGGANGVGGAVLNGSITETGPLASALTIEGLVIHATGSQNGISLTPTLSGAQTITVNNVAIDGASQTGFLVLGGGTDLTVNTTNSSFSGNGILKTSGGSGDIDFFEFLGNAAFDTDTIAGTALGTSLAQSGDNAIQIAGFDEATHDVTNPLGNVSFTAVAISGTYAKNLIYIQGYDNASHLTFNEANTLGTPAAPAQSGWTSLFVDLGSQGGTYTPDQTPPSHLEVPFNASWSFVGTSPGFAALAAAGVQDLLKGSTGADTIIGSSGNDFIAGNGGIDTVQYHEALTAADFTYNTTFSAWVLTTANEGTDLLQGIASVADNAGHHFLMAGQGGGYLTVQNALDAAHNGDTVLVSQGSFTTTVDTGHGIVTLHGNGGEVFFAAAANGENLVGGTGNDVFVVNNGTDFGSLDSIDGGAGHNVIYFTSQTPSDQLIIYPTGMPDYAVGNIQEIDLVDPTTFAPDGVGKFVYAPNFTTGLTFVGNNGHDDFTGGSGDDTFAFTSAQFNAFSGGTNEAIHGGDGSDTLLLTDPTAPVTLVDALFADYTGFTNVVSVETIKAVTSGNISFTLGSHAADDVFFPFDSLAGVTGNGTLTLDLSAATGKLTLDASGFSTVDPIAQHGGTVIHPDLKVLLGIDGHDFLTGGPGTNIYDFGAPPAAGNNQITNFTTSKDEIDVSAKGFGGGLTAGQDLSLGNVFGSDATTGFASPNERFHFDTANTTLYYSSTGSAATAIALAHIEAGGQVQAHDIHVHV
jgi:hypothetical protein